MRASAIAFLAVILLSGTTFAQAPEITSHSVISMRSVDFVFSTLMHQGSVEDPANMAIYPTGSPGDTLETWTVLLNADGITMHLYLIEPMIDGVSYTLALDGVRSGSGIYVEEGFEYTFTATDIVPPALLSVSFLAPDQIDLVFTEDIVEAAGEEISNYGLFETSTPGNTISFNGARMRGIYERVSLELDQEMIPLMEYTITAANLHDLSGNPLPGGSELAFIYTNTNSHPIMGLYADYERNRTAVSGTGQYSFDMWFWVRPQSETARAAGFMIDYPDNVIPHTEELNPAFTSAPLGDIYTGVGVVFDVCYNDWVWIYRQTVTVTDDQPALISIFPWVDGNIKNVLSYSCELAEEIPMDVTSNIEINAPDARPLVVDASFSGLTTIDFTFNIPMDQVSTETISNYEIFETSTPGNIVSIASITLLADGQTARLISAATLPDGMGYTARLTGMESAAGTTIYPGTEITFTAFDDERPYLVSAARTSQLTVDVLFNEPVDSKTANSVLNYDLVKSSDHDSHVELYSATLQEDGSTVRLRVNSYMEDGTLYTVLASNVKDLRGNIMHSLGSAEFTADDIYPPSVLSISSIPGNIIKVHFDEAVDSATAVDPDNYYLRNNTLSMPITLASVEWEGTDIFITADITLAFGGWHSLYIRNVEDESGNADSEWVKTDFDYTPEVPEPQIGLWFDSNRNLNSIRVYPYETFEFYVWCNPGPEGLKAIEYALQNTSLQNLEYYVMGLEHDPDNSISVGDLFSGITNVVYGCKTDWFWITKVTCILIDGRGYIDVGPHLLAGGPQATLCTEGYPLVQLKPVSGLFINEWLIGTLLESSSAEYNGSGIEVSWVMQEIDEDPDFIIHRKKTGDAGFTELESKSLAREGMSYSFVDDEIENGTSYIYRIEYAENGELHTLFETEEVGTPLLPLALDQNCPNPFNPSTSIGYYLPESCNVRLEIFDASGRLVNILQNGTQASGKYNVDWNGTNSLGSRVSSGIYFYRLTAGKETISKKMVLLR